MRGTSREAAKFFRLVQQISSDRWGSPGLRVWTDRDLVGHSARAPSTVETYVGTPADQIEIAKPVGQSLGPQPANRVRRTVERVRERLESIPDTDVLVCRWAE